MTTVRQRSALAGAAAPAASCRGGQPRPSMSTAFAPRAPVGGALNDRPWSTQMAESIGHASMERAANVGRASRRSLETAVRQTLARCQGAAGRSGSRRLLPTFQSATDQPAAPGLAGHQRRCGFGGLLRQTVDQQVNKGIGCLAGSRCEPEGIASDGATQNSAAKSPGSCGCRCAGFTCTASNGARRCLQHFSVCNTSYCPGSASLRGKRQGHFDGQPTARGATSSGWVVNKPGHLHELAGCCPATPTGPGKLAAAGQAERQVVVELDGQADAGSRKHHAWSPQSSGCGAQALGLGDFTLTGDAAAEQWRKRRALRTRSRCTW